MDRTAAAGEASDHAEVSRGADSGAEPLPRRRPSARAPEIDGEPVNWFGGEPGPLSAPVASSASTDSSPLSPAAEPAPISSPPEFGPASPGGQGRVSFGFSDGPIGGTRPSRSRDEDDTPARRDERDTGGRSRRTRAGGAMGALTTASGALPLRGGPRARVTAEPVTEPVEPTSPAPAATGAPEELPIVRKTGNGTEGPDAAWQPTAPFNLAPADVPWPTSVDAGAAGPLTGLAAPLWPAAAPESSRFETSPPSPQPEPSGPVVWADTPADKPAGAPPRPRPRQSRLVTAGMAVLGVVAVAAVALTGVVYYTGDDNQISEMLQGQNSNQVVSGPLGDQSAATFELMAATDRVRLRIGELGGELYRVSAPEGTGVRPSAELRDDRLRVDLARDAAGTGGEVEIVLAAKVRWTIRFSGYSAERIVDLTEGRIKAIEMVGGTRRAEMTLAEASGTVPMRITGGVEELILRAPAGSPVRIKVGGGAGSVTAGSRTLKDVAPGSTLTPKDWSSGNRYDVDAVAPVTLLTVETA